LVKPVEPDVYDGSPDAEKFQRFVLQSTQYCKAGGVPKKEQVYTISTFLSSTAASYFAHAVARNHSKWSLRDFFDGVFNYCFPVDYRDEQTNKLDRFHQGNRTVLEYVHELERLFDLSGTTDKRTRVVKLWKGFTDEIRYELRRSRLS
ncbi:hypothetical protein BT96DRAFT_749363, partial [Gymnopus androsaceus JB14]